MSIDLLRRRSRQPAFQIDIPTPPEPSDPSLLNVVECGVSPRSGTADTDFQFNLTVENVGNEEYIGMVSWRAGSWTRARGMPPVAFAFGGSGGLFASDSPLQPGEQRSVPDHRRVVSGQEILNAYGAFPPDHINPPVDVTVNTDNAIEPSVTAIASCGEIEVFQQGAFDPSRVDVVSCGPADVAGDTVDIGENESVPWTVTVHNDNPQGAMIDVFLRTTGGVTLAGREEWILGPGEQLAEEFQIGPSLPGSPQGVRTNLRAVIGSKQPL